METDPIMRREAEEKLSKVKSLKTTMYVLVGVAVALVAVLAYVWSQKSALISELEDEKQDLTVQMENLQNDYASLSSDYDPSTPSSTPHVPKLRTLSKESRKRMLQTVPRCVSMRKSSVRSEASCVTI